VLLGNLDVVVGAGVASLLRGDSRGRMSVLEFGGPERALEAAVGRWEPQVVVLGESADATVVARLRGVRPQAGILVLVHEPTRDLGLGLLASGANCVARNAPEVDLGMVVRLTAQGERFYIAGDGERVERRYPSGAERLTEREQQVLMLLVGGSSYSSIACALSIGYRTVQTHVSRILAKLGMQDRRELVGLPLPWLSAGE
jgi:DNA-binding NarL/FixJ family response regulator